MTPTQPATVDVTGMTRAQRAALPLTADVAEAIAEQHGVCVRPLAMRRIDATTGRVDVLPVPCGSTREDQCRPCADKARRLRMVQCRQGWHLDAEPVTERTTPSEEHKELLATRADLVAVHAECREVGDEATCEQITESVAELDTELRALEVRGRLTPLDPPPKPVKRSTRRRQDTPDLPRQPVEKRTVGWTSRLGHTYERQPPTIIEPLPDPVPRHRPPFPLMIPLDDDWENTQIWDDPEPEPEPDPPPEPDPHTDIPPL